MHTNVQLYKDFSLLVESFLNTTYKGEDECISNDAPGRYVHGNQMGCIGSDGYIERIELKAYFSQLGGWCTLTDK